MVCFGDMSNELILCIWDQFSSADVIYSFSNLNTRLTSLLIQFHGLFKELDLRYCSLAAGRFFCRQVPNILEWRLHLTVLKLNNRYRCYQMHLFADEIIRVLARQDNPSNVSSKEIFRAPTTCHEHLQPIFPRLVSFVLFQSIAINESCRDALLYGVTSASTIRTLTWHVSLNQTHHSQAFFDWLFQCGIHLISFQLHPPSGTNGFELTYEHTLRHHYVPHSSLVRLKIDLLDINTLYVLLHCLPQLEYLDVYISKCIDSMDTTVQNLPTKFDHPKQVRQLSIRLFLIRGVDCSCFVQFVNKFANTLESLSLYLLHWCNDDIDQSFNGYRLTRLCSSMTRLRSLDFVLFLQRSQSPSRHILWQFIEAFRTPFWLNGPFGRKQVCVDYHQMMGFIHICSLPYKFSQPCLFRTTHLLNTLFNTRRNKDEENDKHDDLSLALRPLWSGMRVVMISLMRNENIPISLLYALRYPTGRNKQLILIEERGLMPKNVNIDIQLTHFNTLQLNSASSPTQSYDLQALLDWLRLLPNVKRLFITSSELRYWCDMECMDRFLARFLQNLDQLFVDCSSIINRNISEELHIPLLSFIINQQYFQRLRFLRFIECKHISSTWCNVDQWIDFIVTHVNRHQLVYVRFDFIEHDHGLPDLQSNNKIITILEPLCVIHIHRFVLENHISLWIERNHE